MADIGTSNGLLPHWQSSFELKNGKICIKINQKLISIDFESYVILWLDIVYINTIFVIYIVFKPSTYLLLTNWGRVTHMCRGN